MEKYEQYTDWKIVIKPKSAFLTPLQADTIWGMLAWACYFIYGEKELNKVFIPQGNSPPPLLVSDGFPDGYLPRPLLPYTALEVHDWIISQKAQPGTEEYMRVASAAKRWLKKAYWPLEDVLNLVHGVKGKLDLLKDGIASEQGYDILRYRRRSDDIELKSTLDFIHLRPMRHNIIDRRTGTAKSKHGLYTHQEIHLNKLWCIYVRSTYPVEKLETFFKFIGRTGFGKRASTGLGKYEIIGEPEKVSLFKNIKNPDSFITLSSSYVTESPIGNKAAYYQYHIKHGKIGSGWKPQKKGNFLKRPLVMFSAGSLFESTNPAQPWQGILVRNGHREPAWPIVHYGYAFPVQAKILSLEA